MDHAVTYSTNLIEAADHTFLRICQNLHDLLDSLFMIRHFNGDSFLGAVFQFEFEERVGEPDFFHAAFGKHFLVFAVDQLIFNAAASAVQNEYFHF